MYILSPLTQIKVQLIETGDHMLAFEERNKNMILYNEQIEMTLHKLDSKITF